MARLGANISDGRCVVCWQWITTRTMEYRPSMMFQGRHYHVKCWEKQYKTRHKATHKKAEGKRSF